MDTFTVNKVPYFDIEDTIAEVDISRRQLSHWESQGLMQAELGPKSNRYTVQDIRRLKALKHLVVDRKLPLPLVKEVVSGGVEHGVSITRLLVETAALFNEPPTDLRDYALDFEKQHLAKKSDLANAWWNEHLALAPEEEVEQILYDLLLLLFRIVRGRLSTPAAFAERKTEIFRTLTKLSDTARVETIHYGNEPDDFEVFTEPRLRDEPSLDAANFDTYEFVETAKRLTKYAEALTKRFGTEVQKSPEYRTRFWNEKELQSFKADIGEIPF